jgi:hypothetical protein
VDNPSQWGPRPVAIGLVTVAGLLMAAGFLVAGDAPGRFLSGVAAVGLLVFAAGSWRARPRLAITPDGLVYRGWLSTRTLRREDIDLLRITEFRRWGRTVRLLEIDIKTEADNDQLLVLSRWDLGGDPLEVLDALTAAGYARGR